MRAALLLLACLSACVPTEEGKEEEDVVGPAKPTGLDLLGRDELEQLPVVEPPDVPILPPAVDLRADFPPTGDQGGLGSCVAFATTYALRSYLERKSDGKPLIDAAGAADPARVFSPAFTYNNIPRGPNGGSTFPYALSFLHKYGALPWKESPYDGARVGPPADASQLQRAEAWRIGGWGRVDVKTRGLKAFLATKNPILFGAPVDQGFKDTKAGDVWKSRVGPVLGGHAMVLVGYDDAKGAYRLQNSWGTAWGDGGTGWIDYAWLQSCVNEGFVAVRDASPASKEPKIGPPGKLKKDEPPSDTPTDPAAIRVVSITPRTLFRERRAHGSYVRVTGEFSAPPGTSAQVKVEFFADAGGGRKGAAVAFAGPEPGPPVSGASDPLPLPGSTSFTVYTAHSRLDLADGRHALILEPVLYVDGTARARGDARRFELEK
ncbi:MAG TPA: C1 family peptidase [Planctomycetota bacterium]